MYKRIMVPVDSSKQSDEAVRTGAAWAERMGATVIGFHAYAARLHEGRFKQMEPGLPERYQEPEELEHQRDVHNTLISEGLNVISDSYLDQAEEVCRVAEVPYERQAAEGRNYVEILREIDRDGYDLVAMSALGLGQRRRSIIGGVTERVLRRSPIDMLVVRKKPPGSSGLMVAVDGSPQGFNAVDVALRLGKALEEPIEVVSAFDPQFHVVAFKHIESVLSEEGARLFRFEEQQKLHEEIIDKGLEKLYQGHLDTAARMAEEAGAQVQTTLLTGKPFQAVLDHAQQRKPSLLVVGRFGLHRTEYSDIGNTSENMARLAKCSVLVLTGELTPHESNPAQDAALPHISWTQEAEARLSVVPEFARGMARQAIEDYVRRLGQTEVTEAVMALARENMGM